MKNKKTLTISIIIIVTILIIIFIKNNYIFSKKGNNITNKSADEIKEYILNIESYKAVANVTIKSNKNQNSYILLQEYNEKTKKYIQEVIEPKNIEGVKFIYDGNNLKLENTKLSLNKIYSEYKYIDSNELSLISFIEDFKSNKNSRCFEEKNMVLLETEVESCNKYVAKKILYINKEEGKIEKLEIKDRTQKARIYILYNEIEINELSKE